jgi:hypothetical protein
MTDTVITVANVFGGIASGLSITVYGALSLGRDISWNGVAKTRLKEHTDGGDGPAF